MFAGNKSFFSSQRRGGKITVSKQVRKVYLRSDIPCGSEACEACQALMGQLGADVATLEGDAASYIIPDTNVFLHNIDAIEAPAVKNVIVLDTVLQEVKGLTRAVYDRLVALIKDPEKRKRFYVFSNENHRDTACPDRQEGETPNDHNDRLIREAAKWYQLHLSGVPKLKVILLTHDKANREKALASGMDAMSMSEYVTTYLKEAEGLLDMVASATSATNERAAGRKKIYAEYLSPKQVESGLVTKALLKGSLRQSATNMHEGTVSVLMPAAEGEKKGKYKEFLIPSKRQLNRCMDSDVVAIKVLPVEDWTKPSRLLRPDERKNLAEKRPTAKTNSEESAIASGFSPTAEVVALLENKRKPVCGSILVDKKADASNAAIDTVLFRAVKSNIPYVRLRTRQAEQLKGKRIQVAIDSWDANSPYPEGHCVRVLGDIGDKDTEAEVILLENDVPFYQFPQKVLDCLPTGEWHVEASEEAVRTDFRHRCVVSVDPPGCKDIDDALHCHKLPNGNYEVGVHIADVTHFMKEGTPLDEEAQKRSTSVYLVDRRIDMLPKLLTENLCSLVGNEERYTFSCWWEMTPDAKVVKENFGKGIIKSRSAMSYYTAQDMVDDPKDNSEIAQGLKGLLRLSQVLKARRIEAGALTLASQEMKFTIDMEDSAKNPTDVTEYVHIPTMSMIEEFMLFANVAVAAKIEREFPKWACLRRHPAPSDGAMDSLNEALATQNMPLLDTSTSRKLADSLDAVNDQNDPYFNKLVRMLTTRCMNQAKYFSSGELERQQYWHYGLAMEIYTHFTSPIRRFADVVVHRQLAAAIGIAKRSDKHMDQDVMSEITQNMNYRHTLAQHAGRDSRNLFIGYVFDSFKEGKEIPEQEAYVTRVLENGVTVMVPRYGTEGNVYVEDCKDSPVDLRKLKQLDKVRVRMTLRADAQDDVSRNKLMYEVIECVQVQRVAGHANTHAKADDDTTAKAAPRIAPVAQKEAAPPAQADVPAGKRKQAATDAPAGEPDAKKRKTDAAAPPAQKRSVKKVVKKVVKKRKAAAADDDDDCVEL